MNPSDGRASVALVTWSELSPSERARRARRIRLEAASAGAGGVGTVADPDPAEHALGVERMIRTMQNGYERRRREHIDAVRLELDAELDA